MKIVKDLSLTNDNIVLNVVYTDENNIRRTKRLTFALLGADYRKYKIFFKNGNKRDYRKNNLYLKQIGTNLIYTAFEFIEKRNKEIQKREDCLHYIKEDSFLNNTLRPLYNQEEIQIPKIVNKYEYKQIKNIPTTEADSRQKFENLAVTEFLKAIKGDLTAYKSILNKLKGAALLYGFTENN